MNSIVIPILACLVGVVIGVIIMMIASRNGLDAARVQAEALLDESKVKAENVIRQATLDGKQQVYDMKLQAEKEIKDQRNRIQQTENKLIYIGKPVDFDKEAFLKELSPLQADANDNKEKEILERIKNLVPTFTPVVNE